MKMKLKLVTTGIVTASAIGLAVGGRALAVVGGPTCNVPTDYSTIQAAVNDNGCTTIKVAAGTYSENVTIGRSLTLKGSKAGSNVDNRTAAGPNESTVNGTVADSPVFTVNAANVTIDGFSVTNPDHGLGIDVKTAGDNAIIKNNIVDGLGNSVYSANTVGVYLELGPDNVKVNDNRISHVQSGPSAQGVLVGDSTSNNPSLGVVLDDNTITDITSTAKGAYGIQLNNGSKPTASGYTTAKVTDNTIKNLNGVGWVHAIGLEGDTPNIVVRGNTISNLVSPSANKVAVWFEDNVFFFTGEVNQNSLDVGSTAAGIAVNPALTTLYPTLSVDGTCNWWGNKNGPGLVASGSGSLVTTGVDYKPWSKSARLNKGNCDGDHHDFNDSHSGHGRDDKDRWNDWNDWDN